MKDSKLMKRSRPAMIDDTGLDGEKAYIKMSGTEISC